LLKEESNDGSPENRVDFMELTAATTLVRCDCYWQLLTM